MPATTRDQRAGQPQPLKNGDSNLLALPAELRNKIYRLAVGGKPRIRIRTHGKSFLGDWIDLEPALTRVCRQIRKEALPMFYDLNTIAVAISLGVYHGGKAVPFAPPANPELPQFNYLWELHLPGHWPRGWLPLPCMMAQSARKDDPYRLRSGKPYLEDIVGLAPLMDAETIVERDAMLGTHFVLSKEVLGKLADILYRADKYVDWCLHKT